jgi:type I restriction enzyme M protein
MLNTETKKHIDAARDVLVGVAPNPMTQIDQITYALIYKFMDDMDQSSIRAGGEPSFFTGPLEPYAWSKLVDTRVGNQEKMNLYGEALSKFAEAKQLPELFRTIFRGAALPYRSPETLGLFLKEINYFDYKHSEELGNAYEYLLSLMSAQGDAGQFRTPRHIIDFIVDVVDPTKDETVLDPACGTAGFLISSYNHILEKHDGLGAIGESETPLTPAERKKLMGNFQGYDIDEMMVRLAQVNMYLHLFKNPQIFQYDSLTQEDRWPDKFDVILANPPFMTPKGGITPHTKFTISSRKAEALFVDYIVGHLKTEGRAALIVPDGIVANSSYKKLRKMLIENGLWAVVKLHGFAFKPYAGAKTSILFIDKARKSNGNILFGRVDNDGFEKGEQRRPIEANDLPAMLETLRNFYATGVFEEKDNKSLCIRTVQELDDYLGLFVNQHLIEVHRQNGKYPMRALAEIFTLEKGTVQSSKSVEGEYAFITASEEWSTHDEYTHVGPALVFAAAAEGSLGRVHIVEKDVKFVASDLCFVLKEKKPVDYHFYLGYFKSIRSIIVTALAKGASKTSINKTDLGKFLITEPPYDTQTSVGDYIRTLEARRSEMREELRAAEAEQASIVDAAI